MKPHGLVAYHDEIVSLYESGKGVTQIAQSFGVTPSSIYHHLAGIEKRSYGNGIPSPRWVCTCGPREDFDGIECRRCHRRSEARMAATRVDLGWPPLP